MSGWFYLGSLLTGKENRRGAQSGRLLLLISTLFRLTVSWQRESKRSRDRSSFFLIHKVAGLLKFRLIKISRDSW